MQTASNNAEATINYMEYLRLRPTSNILDMGNEITVLRDISSSDSEYDSEIEEFFRLAKIKYKRPPRSRRANNQPTVALIPEQDAVQTARSIAEDTTIRPSRQPPQVNEVVTTDDILRSRFIELDTLLEKIERNEIEPTAEEEPVLISNNTNQTAKPKICILEDILLPTDKIFHSETQTQGEGKNRINKNSKKMQRELNKKLREEGKSYLGYRRDRKVDEYNPNFKVLHDTLKPAKCMGPRCASTVCQKSKLRGCHEITDTERQNIFDNFWRKMSWQQKRQFVCSNVSVAPCKRKITKSETSRKSETKSYYLLVSKNTIVTRVQVCRVMFLQTLGMSEWFLRYWLDKTRDTNNTLPKSEASLHSQRRTSPITKVQCQTLNAFFDNLPKLPSHHCQHTSGRLYLEPMIRNISELYEVYKKYCQEQDTPSVCRRTFDNEFLKRNLSLYPKEDQCDICYSYKVGNVTEEVWKSHTELAMRVRAEKNLDKSLAIEGACHVLTHDIQAVKMAPKLQVSASYFETRLYVHNFTTFNLGNYEVECYWFDESNGSLEASVIASCIVHNVLQLLKVKKVPVILYSDGWCVQNRNSCLSNALLRVAMEQNVEVTQKFLVQGHTVTECDSVHRGQEIYLPSQYSALTKAARFHGKPYNSIYLDYTFFTDFSKPKNLIYKSIRPGRKSGDPTVTDIRVLIYKPDGTIWYKLNFDEDPIKLPQRSKLPKNTIVNLPRLYRRRLSTTKRKWKHLQELKRVIPSDCHSFYDNLPH